MNKVYLYTIWMRIPDTIENPLLPKDSFLEPGQTTFTVVERNPETGLDEDVEHDVMILDPNNRSGIRYVAIKCVDNLDVAKSVCENSNGDYVYTYSEAWYGMSD